MVSAEKHVGVEFRNDLCSDHDHNLLGIVTGPCRRGHLHGEGDGSESMIIVAVESESLAVSRRNDAWTGCDLEEEVMGDVAPRFECRGIAFVDETGIEV